MEPRVASEGSQAFSVGFFCFVFVFFWYFSAHLVFCHIQDQDAGVYIRTF